MISKFNIEYSTQLSKTIKTIKEDCKIAYNEYTKHYTEVIEKIVNPLKELLVKHSKQRDRLEEEQKATVKLVQDAKIDINNKHIAYIEAFKTFDNEMSKYEENAEKSTIEKKSEDAKRIVGLLKKCKETEKDYISCVNTAKLLISEVSIANVFLGDRCRRKCWKSIKN